jgi:quinoprotein glucose dehydrogenase
LSACSRTPKTGSDWPVYGGHKDENRSSALTQINRDNVQDLRVAWTYHSSDSGKASGREVQCQPIVIGGTLYATNTRMQLFALDAATGTERWKFDPFAGGGRRAYNQNRGVVYWADGDDKRILYTAGPVLYAVNAETGQPIGSFGTNGQVDLFTGLDINHPVDHLFLTATSPGIIYKNILVLGSTVSESGDAAPGYVRGFDVRTGKMAWIFHTIPQPGDPGYDTWPKDAYRWAGGTNAWAGMALDEKRGLVFFGTGSPSSDFYGGARAGKNLFANCIVALQAETGRLQWYYQTIHHDLWDRDLPCPPSLATVRHGGKPVDVVVQATKDGLVYVLDRDSGTSLFPIEERAVPTAGLPGEQPWPTQPYPLKPLPFCAQDITDSDITDLSPAAHAYVQKQFAQFQHGNKFLPPSTRGTLLVGYSGGAEWGGNAVDSNGILYQNGNNALWVLQMISMEDRRKEMAALSLGQGLFLENCASCHGADRKGNGKEIPSLLTVTDRLKPEDIGRVLQNGQGRMPSFQTLLNPDQRKAIIGFLEGMEVGAARVAPEHREHGIDTAHKGPFPYEPRYVSKRWDKLTDSLGYPALKRPWGTLNAIDLNTGDYRWRVSLGEVPDLAKQGIRPTGTESYGGPLVTAGGLVFIAGTRDEKIRAFDTRDGKVVWEYRLPAGGFATPITYMVDGVQYIVIAAGGNRGLKPGGDYVAFALPGAAGSMHAGWGGWILMGAFVGLALLLRISPVLKGFSFTVLIFAAVSLAMYYPDFFVSVHGFKLSGLIVPLLQVIMFGMGTELSIKEFREVVRTPRSILIGVVCHYTIMPLVGVTLAHAFHFPKEIAAGIILVGCCPSGLASNVMSYLAKANLALSVSVTTVSTLLAPLITPLLMHYLAGSFVTVHFWAMAWDITQIVILPIAAGLAFHYGVKGKMAWLDRAMPLISMAGIALIIVVITAAGRNALMEVGLLLILASFLQNIAGYLLGYGSARLLRLPERDCRTISLEVGMQNGGLASGIALGLGKLATVGLAPAVFGPLMNITGSGLATWWHRRLPEA